MCQLCLSLFTSHCHYHYYYDGPTSYRPRHSFLFFLSSFSSLQAAFCSSFQLSYEVFGEIRTVDLIPGGTTAFHICDSAVESLSAFDFTFTSRVSPRYEYDVTMVNVRRCRPWASFQEVARGHLYSTSVPLECSLILAMKEYSIREHLTSLPPPPFLHHSLPPLCPH